MKFSAIVSLLLVGRVAGQSPCPAELTQQADLSSTETLYYEVIDGVFCARIESESEGWLGFGISSNGSMVPAEAVIGVPDDGSVLKYDLTSKDTSGVVPMSDDKQTLLDASIVQEGGKTTMTFAKVMDEDEYPLVIGDNSCIYAQADSNTLGYHGGNRGSFTLTLEEASTATSSTTASSTAETTQAPTDTETQPEPDGGSSGNMARNVSNMLLGVAAIATWFGM